MGHLVPLFAILFDQILGKLLGVAVLAVFSKISKCGTAFLWVL